MFQTSWSRSPSSDEFERLVFANAAQQNPLCVRTATVAVPGSCRRATSPSEIRHRGAFRLSLVLESCLHSGPVPQGPQRGR
jgi:hypothetical protein